MTVETLPRWLKANWEQTKADLLAGRYRPRAVRGVDIPKPGGGTRMLGIPTVLDRLIQQAIHQVLSPLWEPEFSDHSHGFRPGRSAHQAVKAAQGHVEAGPRWVVDMDLEKFFDRVNHDILMARLARKIRDKTLLRLIRCYLEPGMMDGGIIEPRTEGTPQGGPLSPLLSNILLDDLDKELERRGHRFERYADDCNIYVKSKAAGERVLSSVTKFVEKKLRLRVNAAKSAVARPWKRKFDSAALRPSGSSFLAVCLPSVGSWLQHDLPPQAQAQSGGAKGGEVQGQSAATLAAKPGTQPWALYPRRPQPRASGLGDLLPPERNEGHLRGTRCLGAAQAPMQPMAAMETRTHPHERTAPAWTGPREGQSRCLQRTRLMVECQSLAYERRATGQMVPRARTCLHARSHPTLSKTSPLMNPNSSLNRRMRNRTSGGVGGRRG